MESVVFEKKVIESSFNYYIESSHTYTNPRPNPRPGQYLAHAHSHITRAVAAMGSCFALIGPHQHGIAAQSMNGENPRVSKTLYCRGECKHSFMRRLRTEIFSVHCLGGYAMLMSPNKGETAAHGCHCPGDMAVRMREVLARPWVRPWVGVCVARFNIIIEC